MGKDGAALVYEIKESWTKMLTIKHPDDLFVDYD
uniref:Uncharacterized protein n=1 Tax=Solanum lycopersicum TaxID=4081 RepID=K4C4B7_SOLLC